ncbi:MAG: glycine cleavage system protein GcvH [Dehalococcoidia bacterium]|nr:glycine cleavage system protein GcvH [Dehalococcoidia bacterium]
MHPVDRRYTKEHEWVLLERNGRALVGITAYAQEQLGDVVFLDLPKKGTRLEQTQKLGEIESVKAVSDIYTPLNGVVFQVNQELVEHPELVNEDPYGKGWMVRLSSVDAAELEKLLTAEQYEQFLSQLQ